MATAGAVVPRLWPGETVVCLASGPSLTREDVEFCRGKARVVCVSDTYALAPWADVLYSCDVRWWRWHWHKGAKDFQGLKVSIDRQCLRQLPDVMVLANTGTDGLETNPSGLRTGKNSGYQAINLAVHLGAARIVLLGYDMQRGPHGEEHFFGHHPNGSRSPYSSFVQRFRSIVQPLKEARVDVINCTRRTALTCFPLAPLEEVLMMREVAA